MTSKLSNPFSTGGGGVNFESHVQATLVTLMLTGGHAPCLPCWPIVEIKLQGKIDGFDTDDLIVVVENFINKEQRKLLGQVKNSINITSGSTIFGEVIQAAWNDFNDTKTFKKGKDVIALITGPLSKVDADVVWVLNHARTNKNNSKRFFRNIETAKFSSNTKRDKLQVIRDHLKAANDGNDLTDEVFHEFLMSFFLLGYDLGEEEGVVLSLINSHISQFQPENSRFVWSRILEFTCNHNQHAGCITLDCFPDELTSVFAVKHVSDFPVTLTLSRARSTDWSQHPDASYLALAVLIGSWQDNSQPDLETITQLLGISYDEWLTKAREILHYPDSPLSVKNGIWKVANRSDLASLLGSRILDQNLDKFRVLAISVLQELDPAFELPTEERYAASIHGKVLKCSQVMRTGIAEGLAILGSQPEAYTHCSQGKVETVCVLVIRELLTNANWVLWGSLNGLLPTLAEAAPSEFIDAVEKALSFSPCPFDELFSQEGNGITGGNYLTGLLWALEGLAWDEQFLIRVCVALAELASHDPGGQWANRPSNSLTTILLPWLPQTLASVDKRKVAVQAILREWPDIFWNLIVALLPGQHQTSSGTNKPIWRNIIPDDWEKDVPSQEYWQQVYFYAELAVSTAEKDTKRLAALIDILDSFPQPAFDQLFEVHASQPILELPEEQRLLIWNRLTKFTSKHRRHSDASWALPDEQIARIEHVAKQLAPANPFNLYQHLFAGDDFELYEENGDWDEQRKKFDDRRQAAVLEILQQDGIEGVIKFSESVSLSDQVGVALGVIACDVFEPILLPSFLDSTDNKRKALVSGFIGGRYYREGWGWCDNLDKESWTAEQVGRFLAFLPFTKEAWSRASKWLQAHEGEYWTRTSANVYPADSEELAIAIDKLIEHSRPHAAINCLGRMLHTKQPVDTNQCIRALLAAASSNESRDTMGSYLIVKLIKHLQDEPAVNKEDLFRVEWAYIPLLDGHSGGTPKYLQSRMGNNPEFFCELIRLIYRSKTDDQPSRESNEESTAIATNAWRLLSQWKIVPGTQKDGSFNKDHFIEWFQRVKEICTESGHLEVALVTIGEVLIYTPADPDGLWMHRAAASALNDREANAMRDGYRTGTFNSRGAHMVDPTGKPERELAEQFRSKAEEVENAGFQRLAIILKDLADGYDREAERIVAEYSRPEYT